MITYSIASKEHIPQILELYKQLLPDEIPIAIDKANEIWEKIEQNGIKYFIATDNDLVVSTCYLAIIPNLTRGGRSNGFIENVVTDKNYRRMGIAKKTIDMAVKYAQKQNCYKIVLQSGYDREENHAFYEKCGFNGNSKRAFEKRL